MTDRYWLITLIELGKDGFHFSQATTTDLIVAEMCVCERERDTG